jgi:exodeoxyribonuclease VII large subunit
MAKPFKSQWEFGELFPPEPKPPGRTVLSVSELTTKVRTLLEEQIGQVWVSGEITNLRLQSSGHIYFTLKDSQAQLSCVLFRGERVDRSLLQDGRKVNALGHITVYELRGQYQLRVTELELEGIGALQAAFEKLKARLQAEGLFAQERKRPLPRFPQRIGLVTSPTGAAIRDVLHVIQRRNPALEIILAPAKVQGDGAAEEIAAGIRLLNEFHFDGGVLDLVLITRGGGSLEDLWAFNEEVVARAIFESELPVVSAVGHEIDFTISDFVADLRAATPSAAAELITEGVFSSTQFVTEARSRLSELARRQVDAKLESLQHVLHRLARVHPRRMLEQWLQQLDDLNETLHRRARDLAEKYSLACRNLVGRLLRLKPSALLKQRRQVLDQAESMLRERARNRLKELANRIASVEARLNLLGPQQVLARGYSITTDVQSGKILRDASKIKAGQRIRSRLHKGEVESVVEG